MTQPSETVLEARGLAKSYGAVRALAEVDLRLRAGEFVVLFGPNGAGKSTLLQILTGLFSPDAGEVTIQGYDLHRNGPRALRHIGVVFQQPSLDLELSVAGNLRYHTQLHGMPHNVSRPRIAAALERIGLADRARHPARTLSGGNRRRVELVRALLHAPTVLLMDEPTVGLDPGSRRAILEHIHEIRAVQGIGILWATHLVDEAEHADRIVLLHHGQVLHDGPGSDLVTRSGSADLAEAFLSLTRG